jgi:CSLREA domain-containing protein
MIRFPFLPVLVVAVFTGPALLAVTITVDSTEDLFAEDGQCTLREAVYASNNDTASGLTPGECPAGFGADVIVPGLIRPLSTPIWWVGCFRWMPITGGTERSK